MALSVSALSNKPGTLEVYVTGVDGTGTGPDFSQVINSLCFSGGPNDVPEAADLYANRLEAGIDPLEIFADTEEANKRMFQALMSEIENNK